MTDQEQININIQRQIDAQNARIDSVMAKVDMLVAESQQQREDMRRLHERQDALSAKHEAAMEKIREAQAEAQAKHDADMHEMNERFYGKIDDLSKQINDTWKQTMIGVGGMIIALGALIIGALK